jgi:hypothetical protein
MALFKLLKLQMHSKAAKIILLADSAAKQLLTGVTPYLHTLMGSASTVAAS